jgi:membrane protein implicated in regulation of membrane protease activity
MREIFVIVCVLLIVFVLIAFVPLATIWSLNTLFNLEIEYSFLNWLAASWLLFMINNRVVEKSKNG